jgi:hypothetical protein
VTAPGPASQAAAPSTLSDWEALKVISQLRDAAEKANNGEIHIAARTGIDGVRTVGHVGLRALGWRPLEQLFVSQQHTP